MGMQRDSGRFMRLIGSYWAPASCQTPTVGSSPAVSPQVRLPLVVLRHTGLFEHAGAREAPVLGEISVFGATRYAAPRAEPRETPASSSP